jgi:hypothetical protein
VRKNTAETHSRRDRGKETEWKKQRGINRGKVTQGRDASREKKWVNRGERYRGRNQMEET